MIRKLTKQRRYQDKLVREGNCAACPNPVWTGHRLCMAHVVLRQLRSAPVPFLTRHRKRWTALIAWCCGVLGGAELGAGEPSMDWLDMARRIQTKFEWRDVEWKDPNSVKFAMWLARWDRRLRERNTSAFQESTPGSVPSP